jgi:hypothetical protein
MKIAIEYVPSEYVALKRTIFGYPSLTTVWLVQRATWAD